MSFVLIRPGHRTSLLKLQDLMRERYDAVRESRAKEIERRQAKGVPLDDSTDWDAVSAASSAKDTARVRELLAGGALEALPEYEAFDGYDDVEVQLVAVSERSRQDMLLAVAQAQQRLADASKGGDAARVRDASAGLDAAMCLFVKTSVARVRTSGGDDIGGKDGLSDDDVEAIHSTGSLLLHLYLVGRDIQGLAPGKGSRFGSPPPST